MKLLKLIRPLAAALAGVAALAAIPVEAHADASWHWDGRVNNLAWDGSHYFTDADSFLGTPVVVPGDHVRRTAVFKNTGGSSATAIVQLVNVSVDSRGATNLDLQDLVRLRVTAAGQSYDATWRQAAAAAVGRMNAFNEAVSWQAEFPVALGAEFDVTVAALFPVELTGGAAGGAVSQRLTGDIRIVLQGDVASAATGGSVVTGTPVLWLGGIGGVATAGGLFLVAALRRRKADDCG